jgi:molybdenum cofactor biosynthesis enzyme MoaA
MVDKWEYFQSNRIIPERDKILSCYAAFNHMRIRRNGGMSPCCFAIKKDKWVKGEYGLKDYWFGELNEAYRQAFLNQELHAGCQAVCGHRIDNYIQPPINEYDTNTGNDRLEHALDDNAWPRLFEFEISNLCNFACPMCMGELSSKHMLGRDKDLKVYDPNVFDDDENLEQLLIEISEFIPHLHVIRFTGGEPFAHKAFYRIADLITEINPNVLLDVTTNGSVFNKKVERVCHNNKLKLSMSLDTVMPEEYAIIRVGGKHEETFGNVQKFKNLIGSDNIKINSALMSVNAANIDQFFEYARANDFRAFINVYERLGRQHTEDWSLKLVPVEILKETKKRLEQIFYPKSEFEIIKAIRLFDKAIEDATG